VTVTDPRMRHFHSLSSEQRTEAIRRLALAGWSEHGIAAATQLSVEMVRSVLAEASARRAG
jgi:hypothetical protein